MQIVQASHAVLSEKAKPVKNIDKDILRLIENMKITLLAARDPEGVGLAAPQVGESLQIFIIKQSTKAPITVYINPTVELLGTIKKFPKDIKKHKKGTRLEGCLSLKDIWGTVNRSSKVLLTYLDETGKHHEQIINGFLATIVQHEFDHLNGILFPRRVLEQNGQLYKSITNDEGEEEFEEMSI